MDGEMRKRTIDENPMRFAQRNAHIWALTNERFVVEGASRWTKEEDSK